MCVVGEARTSSGVPDGCDAVSRWRCDERSRAFEKSDDEDEEGLRRWSCKTGDPGQPRLGGAEKPRETRRTIGGTMRTSVSFRTWR